MAVRGADARPVLSLYLETPRFLLEVLVTFHIGDEIKVLFRLLAKAYV
jgi:hypothetical protein